MTLTLLIAILAIATLCIVLHRRRVGAALYLAALVLFLAVGCGPVPAWLLGGLQSPYQGRPAFEWGTRNAIVLLGAGTARIPGTGQFEPGVFAYPRLVEAASLYLDCRKARMDCKIVASGGDAQRYGKPEASVYRDALVRLGIPAVDILLEPNSLNTWQNAQFTGPMLRSHGADRVLLVSSGIHMRRSLMYFAHFGIDAIAARADYLTAVSSWLPLSYNFAVADFALHEYIGIARYHVYNAMGWNAARTLPGQA
ncbi:YdcF family protein [Bordetella genomosp. 11]|uniref:DUF218 domain-containing protein n=1 Tax=Bordetella genomosp. 11 TaxID=1416808 RepID=A0A261UZE2_9BORD|nr:YdcF family protein [Bordetella genomosp. 11]OZI67239.1 hypothetical protein CAL28_06040 [Bordetella genomosp. 11]